MLEQWMVGRPALLVYPRAHRLGVGEAHICRMQHAFVIEIENGGHVMRVLSG